MFLVLIKYYHRPKLKHRVDKICTLVLRTFEFLVFRPHRNDAYVFGKCLHDTLKSSPMVEGTLSPVCEIVGANYIFDKLYIVCTMLCLLNFLKKK